MIQLLKTIQSKARTHLSSPLVIFLIVSSLQILDNANITSFFTIESAIQEEFDVSYSIASWTVSAYAVTYASCIAYFGRVSDILNHNKVYISGLISLAICSLIGAVVSNIQILIVFRALQGIAAAATIPPSYAILSHTFEGKTLQMALGGLTALLILASAIGGFMGGAFSDTKLGYRGIMWVSFAWATITVILAILLLQPVDPSRQKKSAGKLSKLDYPGIAMLISGSVLLVTGFTEAGISWKTPKAYIPIIIGTIALCLFLAWETLFFNGTRGASIDLMIPKQMWQVKNFKSIPIVSFFAYGWFFGCYLLVPNLLETVANDTAIMAAVKFCIPQNGAALLTLALMYIIPPKISPKKFCVLGLSISSIGSILITQSSTGLSQYYKFTLPGTLLLASGMILYFVNYLNLILLATPIEMQALVVGICLTMGQFGASLTFAISTSILGDVSSGSSSDSSVQEVANKYTNALYLIMALCISSALITLLFVKDLKPEDHKIHENNSCGDSDSDSDDEREKVNVYLIRFNRNYQTMAQNL